MSEELAILSMAAITRGEAGADERVGRDLKRALGTWGAFEGFARWSNLSMSDNILNPALVTPGGANVVNAADIGVHWYPSEYFRISLDWQHSMFNHPISLAPGVAGACNVKFTVTVMMTGTG